MQDTSEEIMMLQHNIFIVKPISERFLLGMQMIEDGIKLCEAGVKNAQPDISEIELQKEIFKRFYRNDFSEKEITTILERF